jgi:Creatinase/Prolidase N-terminal domain
MELKNLIRIENGEKVKHTFSDAEYAGRQSKLRELMGRENIDAVLFTSYHNINYYADFLYCSFGRKYGLVVTPKKVVSISANIDVVSHGVGRWATTTWSTPTGSGIIISVQCKARSITGGA